MVFGLITAGLGVAQQVMGMVGQAKAAKGGGGGEEAKAEAPKKEEKAAKADGADGAKEQGNPVERFVQMIDGAGSLADIKNLRDQALQGVKPEAREDAKRRLDQAILKKLGIGEPGPNGDMLVRLTPQAQQILEELGMKPDEVRDGAAAGQGPNAPPNAANTPNPPGMPT